MREGKAKLIEGRDDGSAAGADAAGAAAAAAGSGTRGASASGGGSSSSSSAPPPCQALVPFDPEVALLLAEENERQQALSEMLAAVVGSVFSVRKPRDVVAGTSSGLKTISKGLGLGVAALVAQPYIGAKTSGVKGFAKGLGAGLLAFSASTVAGTAVGTTQIIRGVLNTPRAVVQKARGQVWDQESRKWKVDWYSLPEEEAEVFGDSRDDGDGTTEDSKAGGSSSSAAPRRPSKKVVDRKLYDLLEVPPEATDAEIRKAFYKKSLALHPDKNPNNPEATAKFQGISDAYRILGDEERRKQYDMHGEDSASAGLPKIEPVVFFAALFGSHHFEPFIGRLRLAFEIDGDLQALLKDMISEGMNEDGPALDPLKVNRANKQLKKVERQRQVRLAVDLAKRLRPLVGIEDEAVLAVALDKWEKAQRVEAEKLAKTPCGAELLYVIGWIYANRARQFFTGTVLSRLVAQVEGNVHLVGSKATLAGSVGRTALTVNGVMKQVEKKKLLGAKEEDGADKSSEAPGEAAGESSGSTSAAAGASGTAASRSPENPGVAKGSKDAPPTQGKPDAAASASVASSAAAGGSSATGGGGGWFGSRKSPEPAAPSSAAGAQAKPAPAATGPAPANLLPGTVVILQGLQGGAELNNEIGIVVGFDADASRYLVQVMPDVGLKKLKRENLIVIEAPGSDSAGASGSTAPPPGGAEEGRWQQSGGEEQDMMDAFQDCMPLFHDACWSITKLDIEFTLDRVVRKLLKDMSVSTTARRQRASALLKLGELFKVPLKEKRRAARSTNLEVSGSVSDGSQPISPNSTTTGASTTSKKSMLARFKPRVPWTTTTQEKKLLKAKADGEKQKRMEAAFAMMAAGASTEDVDDMAAARAAMEAEYGTGGGGI